MIFTEPHLQRLFDRDGYVVLDFLSTAEVEELNRLHERFEDRLRNPFDASLMSRDLIYRKTVDGEIKRIFSAGLKNRLSDYRISSGGYAIKKSCAPSGELPIHQDWSFVDETRFLSLGIWCPLTDVSRRNGCLKVIRGSHYLNNKPRGMTTPSAYRELFCSIHEPYLNYIEMTAGQVMIFSHRLFHGSESNLADQDRVAVYGILVPTESMVWLHYQDLQKTHGQLEVFEVEDSFLTEYYPGLNLCEGRLGARSRGLINYEFEPITEEQVLNLKWSTS